MATRRARWGGALAAAGLALFIVWGWLVLWAAPADEPAAPLRPVVRAALPPPLPPAGAAMTDGVPAPTPLARLRAEAAPACAAQSVTVVLAGQAPQIRCATPTRTRRSGETTTHDVQSSGGPQAWTLRIEGIGASARRVTLIDALGQRHGCTDDDGGCAGIVIGAADTAGAMRSIVLDHTLLRALPLPRPKGMRAADMTPAMFAADPATMPTIVVSARLTTLAADAAEPACAGAGLSLVSSAGSVTTFCGAAGHEQGRLDGGGELIGFLGYDGPPLRIHVDARRQISSVAFGAFVCEGAACSGVSIDEPAPGDPGGPGSVAFSGTTLTRTGTDGRTESMVLDGRLPMPGL